MNPFAELRKVLETLDAGLREAKCPTCGKPTGGILKNKAGYRQPADVETPAQAGLCVCGVEKKGNGGK